jgi:hypothetical protein
MDQEGMVGNSNQNQAPKLVIRNLILTLLSEINRIYTQEYQSDAQIIALDNNNLFCSVSNSIFRMEKSLESN